MVEKMFASLPNQDGRVTSSSSNLDREWYVLPTVVGGIAMMVLITAVVIFKFVRKRRQAMSDPESRLSAAYRDGFLREDSGPKWRSESLKRSNDCPSNGSKNKKDCSSDIPLTEERHQQTKRLIGQDGGASNGSNGGNGYGGVAKESRVDALWCPQLGSRRNSEVGRSCSIKLNSSRESKIEIETRGEKSYPTIVEQMNQNDDRNEDIINRGGEEGFIEKFYDEYKCKKDALTDEDEKGDTKCEERCDANDENSDHHLGKLFFEVKYDHERFILSIYITKAQNLRITDSILGNCDPYVKLQLLPDKKLKVKTRLVRKNKNPVFDEQFDFYNMEPDQVKRITLHFSVYSFDRFSRDYVIGEVRYPLAEAMESCVVGYNKEDEMMENSGDYMIEDADAGSQSFSLRLCEEIRPQTRKAGDESRGEILLSLCFNPANCQLIVTILKAQDVPLFEAPETIDSYVKIYLKFDGQSLAKKRTASKPVSSNFVFNESFTFQLPRTPSELAAMVAWNCCNSSMTASTSLNRKFILPCRLQGQTCQSTRDHHATENSNLDEKLRPSLFRRFSICSSTLIDKANGADNSCLPKSPKFGKNCEKRPAHILDRFSLSVFLIEEEQETCRDFIGRVEIGRDFEQYHCVSSIGLINSSVASEHWNEIIANPKKQIAKWYKLTN